MIVLCEYLDDRSLSYVHSEAVSELTGHTFQVTINCLSLFHFTFWGV
jgi:hypothetical protein